ncbi:metalloregulator ArsR/SmtB family transcription factor [Clostridium aestuarii]|uniref:Metalloregulator ArsR/SmtB family transcription factor n=1 Tax=Clostridium aestuarii TaxID=338193 RepID=A0ABT4CZQ3_9CLOT|nr:metalloregulator ArsR/SmtB family transcription factor [Clostridium aestuarii]MCY6484466.1 metalloregulator ArsR/SmtB family transcription factor [Clostridium aestuarii]
MDNKKNQIEVCSCNQIHDDVVNKVKENMISQETSVGLAEFFKVLGDTTRIKILYALSINEMCVCDISNLLNMKQSAVSHQLRVLRTARLVKYRKEGKIVYYSLDDEHVESVFSKGLEHIQHA